MRRPAFTLVELLVVIAIIAILSALVVTQLGASQIKARNATAQSDIAEMGKAVESFRTDDTASGAVVSNVPSGAADTLSGTSGTLATLFTGTQDVPRLTYAASVSKTPSSAYTYRYYASGVASSSRQLVQGAPNKPEYALCSNLVNALSPAACIQDGSGTQAGSDQVTAASGQGLLSSAGANGLVAWYQLEGSGSQASAADASSNGNTGTLNNFSFDGTTNGWVPGKYGNSLQFNGVNQFVNVPLSPTYSATKGVTLSAWLKRTTNYNGWIMISGGGWSTSGYSLGLAGGNIYFELQDTARGEKSGAGTSAPAYDGRWHLVTATWGSGSTSMKVYIDGIASGTGNFNGPIGSMTADLWIGATPYASIFFNGSIDDVRIYNRALTANEVQQLYQGTL